MPHGARAGEAGDGLDASSVHAVIERTRQAVPHLFARSRPGHALTFTYRASGRQSDRSRAAPRHADRGEVHPACRGSQPKHGGLFFMAPDNWHHKGTYPASRTFRCMSTTTLEAASLAQRASPRAHRHQGNVDSATRTTRELSSAPLVLEAQRRLLRRGSSAGAARSDDGEDLVSLTPRKAGSISVSRR